MAMALDISCFHQAAIILGKMDHYCGRHTTVLNFQEDYVNLQILIRQEQKTHKGDVPCDKTVLAISNNLQAGLI